MADRIIRRNFGSREVLVDDRFRGLLYGDGWYVNQNGYLMRRVRLRSGEAADSREFLHRVIAGAKDGEPVDHINGNPLDNRATNLRICSHAENMRNRKVHRNNSSGFKGVYPDKSKWRAKITVSGKVYRLGTFETPEKAHEAYCKAAKEMHKGFARTR